VPSSRKFQVIDGKAVVENLSGKEPIREQIAPISFTVENLSTLEGRQGEYRFSGVGPMNGQFEIDGQITVNPVRIQGNYHHQRYSDQPLLGTSQGSCLLSGNQRYHGYIRRIHG
jgi:hypothetical protein